MKQTLHIINAQKIKNAMYFHRKGLSGMGQRLFDIAYNKVKNMEKTVELDSMEMVYVTQSLFSYSKKLGAEKNYNEAKIYRMMATEMEQIRMQFHLEKGPKIKKGKAVSGATLTA